MTGRVLITGATGLVGGQVVIELIGAGYTDLHCVIRSKSSQNLLVERLQNEGVSRPNIEGLKFHTVDLEDFRSVDNLVKAIEPQIVFHTAATVSLSERNGSQAGEKMVRSNVAMTHFLVDALLAFKAAGGDPLLVHTSSVAALGTAKTGMVDEQTPFTDINKASAYARSKFISQNDALKASKMGLRVVVVNPSVVLGINGQRGSLRVMLRMIGRGIPFYTNGRVGYVDVRDVARAMVSLANEPKSYGNLFCLNGANLSFKQFITIFGPSEPRLRLGRRVLIAASWLSYLWSRLSGSKQALTRAVANHLTSDAEFDGSKIVRFLAAFEYTPIEATSQYIAKRLI